MTLLVLPALAALALPGCKSENEIKEVKYDAIAVSGGDFDAMEEVILRLLQDYQLYDGFIFGAAYDRSIDPSYIPLKVETLLGNEDEIRVYGAIFVNSGTRGLGQYVYNGVATDSALLEDAAALENVRVAVEGGRTLVVSDWAYDLVEAIWPDMIEFVGDDAAWDDAQRGLRGPLAGTVADTAVADALGTDRVSVAFDYSGWAVMESVGEGVQVHLTGSPAYRLSESEGDGSLTDVPLLVSFPAGYGQVIFSTFHWRAQTAQVADTLMSRVVGGLVSGPSDTGEEE